MTTLAPLIATPQQVKSPSLPWHGRPTDPRTRTLMFVGAHPDDEAFAIAGTIAALRDDPGLRFILVIATDGEGGEIAPDVDVAREKLGALRRREDAAAWREIGRSPDRVVWLGLPDGGLADLAPGRLTDLLADVMAAERPDVVATFGADGLTGHPDHVAVSEAACAAFHRVARGGGPGLRRLLRAGIRRERLERWNADLAAAGMPIWNPTRIYHFRPLPDEAIGIEVDTSAVADRVVAGIRAHRSQWSYNVVPSAGDGPLRSSRCSESWAVAWPPQAAGTPPLSHVFEGLDTRRPFSGNESRSGLEGRPTRHRATRLGRLAQGHGVMA